MESKAMMMVLVKMKKTGEYTFNMEMMEIYPPNASIPSVDFNNETVVVMATINMLNGDALKRLEGVAKRFYISALESYIKNQWDIMNCQTRSRFLAHILMTSDFIDKTNEIADMSSDEMMDMMKKDCRGLYVLYLTFTSCYEFILNNGI